MPGFTTHYLFGIKNMKHLQSTDTCRTLLKSVEEHKTVFQLGLQGPDVFFYHLASQIRKIRPGSIVHTRWTGDFLKYLIESAELFWEKEKRHTAQAYAAGFIGHYVLDTQMHPYVYCLTGVGEELKQKGYADHIALESDMDASLLMRYTGCQPSQFPYARTIAFGAKECAVVAEVLYFAYNMVFPELALSKTYLAKAIRSMQIGTRLTYNPHNYKRKIANMAEHFLFGHAVISPVIPCDRLQYTEDPLNLRHAEWYNPWNEQKRSADSVPELIKKASVRYQKILRYLDQLYETDAFCETYDRIGKQIDDLLGHQSYHSGLDWELWE